MNKPFLFIGTPTFERRPCIEYIVSMMDTKARLDAAGIDYYLSMLGGWPYLFDVRNRLTAQFLSDHPRATDLLFIDDDIGWPAQKVLDFIHRPEDIVCGVYPKKLDSLEFPVTLKLDDNKFTQHEGLYLAHLAPTGFMRVKRHVMERLAQKAARYPETRANGETRLVWNIFENRVVDLAMEKLRKTDLSTLTRDEAIAHLKRSLMVTVPRDVCEFWGEDYWFVQRWRDMGGSVWVDPEGEFTHRGSKAWKANFGDSVRATQEKTA